MFKSNTYLTNNFQMVAKSEAIRKDTNGYQAEVKLGFSPTILILLIISQRNWIFYAPSQILDKMLQKHTYILLKYIHIGYVNSKFMNN